MDDVSRADLERRLLTIDERIERVGTRLVAGYGSDSDRAGWLTWLDQLRTQREEVLRALGEDVVDRPGD